MMYIDYKFELNKHGLAMLDDHPDEMIKIENTGLEFGDTFVLTQSSTGCMVFKKVNISDEIKQLELNFGI